jgi:hypothetical protein
VYETKATQVNISHFLHSVRPTLEHRKPGQRFFLLCLQSETQSDHDHQTGFCLVKLEDQLAVDMLDGLMLLAELCSSAGIGHIYMAPAFKLWYISHPAILVESKLIYCLRS